MARESFIFENNFIIDPCSIDILKEEELSTSELVQLKQTGVSNNAKISNEYRICHSWIDVLFVALLLCTLDLYLGRPPALDHENLS